MSLFHLETCNKKKRNQKDDDIDTDVEFQRKFQRISALKNHNKI